MGKSHKLVYSDHFSCILTLTDIPRAREKRVEKQAVWNLTKEGGWEKYKLLTDKYSEALNQAIEEGDTMDDKMEAFEKVHEKIKFKSFGKVKIGKSYKEKVGQVIKDPKEQFEEEEAKASTEIDQINKMKLSNIGKVWEIRRRIEGRKPI